MNTLSTSTICTGESTGTNMVIYLLHEWLSDHQANFLRGELNPKESAKNPIEKVIEENHISYARRVRRFHTWKMQIEKIQSGDNHCTVLDPKQIIWREQGHILKDQRIPENKSVRTEWVCSASPSSGWSILLQWLFPIRCGTSTLWLEPGTHNEAFMPVSKRVIVQ